MNSKPHTPLHLTSHPKYSAAKTKLIKLQADLNALEIRMSAIRAELGIPASSNALPQESAIEANASPMFSADSGESPNARAGQLRESLSKLVRKKRVLQKAIQMQSKELSEMRRALSRACIARVMPTHRNAVLIIVEALRALDLAQGVEQELREMLRLGDIELGDLRAMPVPKLGRLADENSLLSGYLIECYEYGFIGLDELPKHLHELALTKPTKSVQKAMSAAVAAGPADSQLS